MSRSPGSPAGPWPASPLGTRPRPGQREGIAKAKSEGRYKGRAPTVRRRAGEILHLRAAGVKVTEIARRIGADRRSVHRVIAAARREAAGAA